MSRTTIAVTRDDVAFGGASEVVDPGLVELEERVVPEMAEHAVEGVVAGDAGLLGDLDEGVGSAERGEDGDDDHVGEPVGTSPGSAATRGGEPLDEGIQYDAIHRES